MRAEIAPVIYDYRDEQIQHLEKLFQKRNTYYSKLYKKGHLKPQQELYVRFENDTFYINHSVTAFQLQTMELPQMIEGIKPGICWLIRILKFEENTGMLFAEITDYQHSIGVVENPEMVDYETLIKIRFRAIDTAKLLQVAVLRKVHKQQFHSKTIENITKVSFESLEFRYCTITFTFFVEEIGIDVVFELENAFIRPEFEVLKPYFAKVLKIKKLPVQIRIEHSEGKILSQNATCLELEKINQEIIDSVKFQFTASHIVKRKEQAYLETNPDNFSRILHDYQDDKRGFVKWRDALEQLLL